MRIKIIKPGIFSTVQDYGRFTYRADGIPLSGAMDTLASRLANMVLGNAPSDAVIEFTYGNASFLTETDMLLAYSGEGAVLHTESGDLPSGKPIFVPSGTSIKIRHTAVGVYTYLAVAGGWDVPIVLGSRSTYVMAGFGGLNGGILKRGDLLQNRLKLNEVNQKLWNELKGKEINFSTWQVEKRSFLSAKGPIRIIPGKEFTWFTAHSLLSFLSSPFNIGKQSNRMGFHLEGHHLAHHVKTELLSTAVAPGTIQVTNEGSLIMLMADSQTTGGYPRIAQIAAVDLSICAQLKAGDSLSFTVISRNDAEKLYLEQEKELKKLIVAIKMIV